MSAHAGAHASVSEVVWSYVTWSVCTCSVPYPLRSSSARTISTRERRMHCMLCRSTTPWRLAPRMVQHLHASLGGRFRYFVLFCSGRGKGESEAPGRGDRFFVENPRKGGGCPRGGRVEGPGGCLRRIVFFFFGGGGLNIFSGSKRPPRSCCSREGEHRDRNLSGIVQDTFDRDKGQKSRAKKEPKAKESHEQRQRIV